MKTLHNFLNFQPFIILRQARKSERNEKNLQHHREGKNFHLLCVLSLGKCFSFENECLKEKLGERMINRRAHVATKKNCVYSEGKTRLSLYFQAEFSLHFPA